MIRKFKYFLKNIDNFEFRFSQISCSEFILRTIYICFKKKNKVKIFCRVKYINDYFS